MANTIFKLRRSSVGGKVPNTSTVAIGELGLNLTDKILYSSDGSTVFEIGANNSSYSTNGSITLKTNDKRLIFTPKAGGSNVYFSQQSDDNFVFYTTDTANNPRAVWSIFANSTTSNLSHSVPVNFSANVGLGSVALYANGTPGTAAQVLSSNGSATYWTTLAALATNTAAQYTWTNTHTFQSNVTFSGNGVGLSTNTGALYLNGMADANWKIGRNTGATTKYYYTNNSLDIIAANSNLEGIVFGWTGNSYLEIGYAGTFTRLPIYVGNSSVNTTINATSFTGTANNSLYLGGTAAASYVQNTDSRTLSGNLTFTGANLSVLGTNTYITSNVLIGSTASFYSINGQANASSGNFIANAYATLSGAGGNYLAFGQQTNFSQWIQSGYSAASPVYYSIIMNPLGGNIGIGNTAPTDKLSINGTTYHGGNVIFGNSTVAVGISANGSYGSAGQSLISNGSAAYWATAGATLNANNTDTQTYYIGLSNATSGAWTNAVVSTTKLYYVPSTGTLSASVVNAVSYIIGSSLTANASGIYHTGTVNASSLTTDAFWANTTAVSVGNSTSNVVVVANNITLPANGYMLLGQSNNMGWAEGKLAYDGFDKTLTFFNDQSDFYLPVGQKEFVRCFNNSGGTIGRGKPVYITGVHVATHPFHSHHPTIALADASDPVKYQVLGLAGHDILNGSHGSIITRGWVNNLNSSGLTASNKVYLGFSAPGTIQSTSPEYPNYPIELGVCLVSDAANGVIYVKIDDNALSRLRVINDAHVGGDLFVDGDLNITGNVTTTSTTNLKVSDNLIYLDAGDTIANTTYTGTGLNDGVLHGVFEGTSSTTYYVKIDTTGTPDKFTWSKDNFVTNVASNVAITGGFQTLDNGLSIQFQATTGHTLGGTWSGTAAPVNVDIGWAGNYNDGTYHHAGMFRDASDGFFKIFDSYLPEPSANVNIDTANTSFHIANFQANSMYIGNTSIYATINTTVYSGTSNNATNLGGVIASSYQLNSTLNANIASYLPTYTGVVNGSSHTVGTSFTANSTMTNTVSLVVSTNTATIGTAAYHVANGNFGIGNSTPADKLVVAGNVMPPVDITYNLGSASLRWANVQCNRVYGSYITVSSSLDIGSYGTSGGGLSVTQAGVYIGNTISNTIIGAANIAFGTAFTANSTMTNTVSLVVSTNTATIGTGSYFVSNGNLGIGNSTPADKLVVVGNITPGTDNSYNLGSATLRWANVFTGDLHLSNERTKGNDIDGTTGNWTIQEGNTELFIINNKNGKKYKFKLEEMS